MLPDEAAVAVAAKQAAALRPRRVGSLDVVTRRPQAPPHAGWILTM